jgi:hypothetical protein
VDQNDDDTDIGSDLDPDIDSGDRSDHDPFEGVFRPEGSLDVDVVSRRLPALVELLRHHEPCFVLRIDFDALGKALIGPMGADLREASGEEAFEDALRAFSRHHLHELVSEADAEAARQVLQSVADDTSLSRKRRQAAAAGVALVGGLPDEEGLRGRGLFDLLLRISLEELHAQEQLRRRADDEGGLDAGELEEFWKSYPALRHHYEERYRHDVQAVLEAIDSDVLPQVVSVDVALRGAHRLLQAVVAAGGGLEADDARNLLHETFEDDLLDGGRGLIIGRWSAAGRSARRLDDKVEAGSEADQKRLAIADACERAVRLSAPGSPGGELILFGAYMRSVIEGSFHVRDAEEAQAAGAMFGEDGLTADGVLAYARHLADRGDADPARRVLVAGVELWPEHQGLRDEAVQQSLAWDAHERDRRQGPTYEDAGETYAEVDADDDGDVGPGDDDSA